MGQPPILSIILTIAIDTMPNNDGVNSGHGLKTLRVNRPKEIQNTEPPIHITVIFPFV